VGQMDVLRGGKEGGGGNSGIGLQTVVFAPGGWVIGEKSKEITRASSI